MTIEKTYYHIVNRKTGKIRAAGYCDFSEQLASLGPEYELIEGFPSHGIELEPILSKKEKLRNLYLAQSLAYREAVADFANKVAVALDNGDLELAIKTVKSASIPSDLQSLKDQYLAILNS